MANNQSNMNNNNHNNSIIMLRDYRKGNWTVQETMVLIEAKKMDEERRTKRSSESASKASGGELRWKWVEDYCWGKGCLRSQNQCNDKWDNLMRDFKRVRDHQRRLLSSEVSSGGHECKSYWETNKVERKERNLPSNMLAQVYDALLDVVERRSGGFRSTVSVDNVNSMVHAQTQVQAQTQAQTQNVVLQPLTIATAIPPPVPPLLSLPPPQSVGPPVMEAAEKQHCHMSLPTVDSDTSEHSDSPAKRRKKAGEKASTSTTNIGSEISKNAYLIAEAIHACDNREETRHKNLLSLHQKRLQIEESKAEDTKQGFNGLVDAINKLANSILALANSNKSH